MEEELVYERPICTVTEDVTGKPTIVIEERLLLVSELKKVPVEDFAERGKRTSCKRLLMRVKLTGKPLHCENRNQLCCSR